MRVYTPVGTRGDAVGIPVDASLANPTRPLAGWLEMEYLNLEDTPLLSSPHLCAACGSIKARAGYAGSGRGLIYQGEVGRSGERAGKGGGG